MASLSQGRTAAAQYGLFTYKSVPVIFEPPFMINNKLLLLLLLLLLFRVFVKYNLFSVRNI